MKLESSEEKNDFMKLESSKEKKATSTTVTIANEKSVKASLDDSKRFDTNLLVAVLIATVSFSAAFTMPGGFNSDGMSVLHQRIFFIGFVLFDTISYFLSLLVVYNHFMVSNKSRIIRDTPAVFIRYSIVAMVLAFASGMFVVLPKYSPLGILVILICIALCYMIIRKTRLAVLPTVREMRTRDWIRSRIILMGGSSSNNSILVLSFLSLNICVRIPQYVLGTLYRQYQRQCPRIMYDVSYRITFQVVFSLN
ncbi:putative PGG domain, protein accelerated cell death 6 [Rosa chinensis]|uniref:Putative PGG domain, protein accelerated cell death 6 n=1 Tax=Rosa chinensis TaxID=74649 RepID=A0A2P6RPH6_ROSCH|nr:putative PGG domain, protein accelerated cell death 6 [Rosa chinensis]